MVCQFFGHPVCVDVAVNDVLKLCSLVGVNIARIEKKMTEERSANSQVSVDMTTTGLTGGNTMTSSSSRDAEFYFQCAVLIIGVVGTATNALILYALVASKQHKKHVLIFNQNALDLFSSFFMVVSYSLMLCNIRLTGSVGYWLCTLLFSESLVWCGAVGSDISLASITIERYLKVVHPVWSKNKLRRWMIYLAMAFSWIGSFVYNAASVVPTTAVVDGTCYAYAFFKNETDPIIHVIYSFISFYLIILLIFVYCYWRILIVIRRQARVMAGHNATAASSAQNISNKIRSNVIKTVILVSAFYAILWLPYYVYILYLSLNPHIISFDACYYALTCIAYMYTCANPFIYATKFSPVKQVLLRLICVKNTSE